MTAGRNGSAPATAKSDAKLIKAKRRAAAALKLREAGGTLQGICDALGYVSKSSVASALEREIRRIPRRDAISYRNHKLGQLEVLRLAAWSLAIDGDATSIRAATAVIAEQCKLMGAYAPTKTEVTGADGGPIDIVATAHDELIARFAVLATGAGKGEPTPPADPE